jgi:hypothetical protein
LSPFARPILVAALLLAAFAAGAGCGPRKLVIDSPANGTFTVAPSIQVTGRAVRYAPSSIASLTVNGINALPLSGDAFSVNVPLDPGAIFNPIVVELVGTNGVLVRERVTVVAGDGVQTGYVLDGDVSPESVALRIDGAGLDQLAPIVESLSSDALDVSQLITDQNPLLDDECVIDSPLGCLYNATVNAVEVGVGGFALDATPNPAGGTVDATITIQDFFIEIDMDVRDQVAVNFTCGLEIETDTLTLDARFDLEPKAADPSFVDVTLVGPVDFALSGFQSQFISGICDDPILGDIIQLLVSPDMIEGLVADGFASNLSDPDGAGPLDSPLAAAIEEALAGISIAGPVGEALGGVLDAPIASIEEDANGLTLLADAAFTNPAPAVGAPDLAASYAVAETPPVFGPTTPGQGLPYGMAFGISSSAMNQLLKTQIEGGLLSQDITNAGGLPITVGLLRLFVPELQGILNPLAPGIIHVRPALAPVFTGQPGPGGELAELRVAGLLVEMRAQQPDALVLTLELDLNAGVDLAFEDGGLVFSLATPPVEEIGVTVLENPFSTDENALRAALQDFFPFIAPALTSALEAFPVPSFLGLELVPVEVARMNGWTLLFADLSVAPTTQLENLVVTDLGTADFRSGSGCFMNELRHRVSSSLFGGVLKANWKGVLVADAGCTTNDQSADALARYRVEFDVVSVPGESWTLSLAHALNGAFSRISDGYNDGIGFQDGGGDLSVDGPVLASVQVDAGSPVAFNATAAPTSVSDGIGGPSTTVNTPFSAAAGTQIGGSGDAHVTVEILIDLHAFSNSNTAFPTANGDELAIRLGKSDTIDSNVTAGGYPGLGGRNIAGDGHFLTVTVEGTPET